MAASLYRDDREATFLAKYGATECLEMFNKYDDPSDQVNYIPDILINTEVEEQYDFDSPPPPPPPIC
jgi:hypothetical protein